MRFRGCFDFKFASENESKFAPTRREKRGTSRQSRESVSRFHRDRSALHEYFRNEVGVNFGHLQRE
jgi:hypothetical protein